VSKASENLATEQKQCDPDGVMVIVSRQAVDETLSQYTEMLKALKAVADFYSWTDQKAVAATPRQVLNAIAKAEGR